VPGHVVRNIERRVARVVRQYWIGLEQQRGCSRSERGLLNEHIGDHQASVVLQVEKFPATARPAHVTATIPRDLPLPAALRVWPNVNLAAARLRGFVRDPSAVGRKLRQSLIRLFADKKYVRPLALVQPETPDIRSSRIPGRFGIEDRTAHPKPSRPRTPSPLPLSSERSRRRPRHSTPIQAAEV